MSDRRSFLRGSLSGLAGLASVPLLGALAGCQEAPPQAQATAGAKAAPQAIRKLHCPSGNVYEWPVPDCVTRPVNAPRINLCLTVVKIRMRLLSSCCLFCERSQKWSLPHVFTLA